MAPGPLRHVALQNKVQRTRQLLVTSSLAVIEKSADLIG